MKIEFSMTSTDLFEVNSWWAKTPEFFLRTLQGQLEAAAAIWPELKKYEIRARQSNVASRAAGGHARAESMTQEQRSEAARKAANTRWSGDRTEQSKTETVA